MIYDKIHIKCRYCAYEWDTLSSMENVTCPSCLNKTPKIEEEDEE